jgi:hypothetical protein
VVVLPASNLRVNATVLVNAKVLNVLEPYITLTIVGDSTEPEIVKLLYVSPPPKKFQKVES